MVFCGLCDFCTIPRNIVFAIGEVGTPTGECFYSWKRLVPKQLVMGVGYEYIRGGVT